DAGESAVISSFNIYGAIFVGNDGVGIEDVFENVIKIAAIGTGQLGTHFAAAVEQGVALRADAIINGAARRGVARQRATGLINAFIFPDFRLFIGVAGAVNTPKLFNLSGDLRVLQILQLAHQVGGEFFDGNGSLRNGSEQ